MIARGNEHRDPNLFQSGDQRVQALPGIGAVEQVTGQHHHITVFFPADRRHLARDLQQFPAQPGGLGPPGKGGVQMPVSAVQNFLRT